MSIAIEEAIETYRKAFERDPDFRHGYQSNIAMCIYDNSVINLESCNKIADHIIKKLFEGAVSTVAD